MLGLTQAELATSAGISTTGLNNIEKGSADPKASTLRAIQAALEASGIIFVPENGGGPGARLTAWKQCSNELINLIGTAEPIATILERISKRIEEYSLRNKTTATEALNRVRIAFGNDDRSRTPNGAAVIEWMDAKIIPRR